MIRLGRFSKASVVAGAIFSATAFGGVLPAQAQSAPLACPRDTAFSYTAVAGSHIAAVPYAQGGPGHTLSIQLTAGAQVTATVTGSVSGGISAIIAGAQAEVSGSLATSLSAAITYGDQWTVPSGVTQGYLAAGATSDRMNWSHGSYNGGCKWIVDAHGTLNAPYHMPAFWNWTT